jgi:serine phosphatase RsbU (regulator of sigma subunit)
MKNKESTFKPAGGNSKQVAMKRQSGLRFRMTVSYALTTVAAVLVLEILAFTMIWTLLTYSSLANYWSLAGATQAAKLYALAASAQAGGAGLDPRTTFGPGRPSSIALSKENFSSNQGYIQYINSRSPDMPNAAFALLITPDGHVLASSYPLRYPVTRSVAQLLPNQSHLVTNALAGVPGDAVEETAQGRIVYAVEPVLSREKKPIGAVYIQVPGLSGGTLLQGFSSLVLISAVFWLLLTLPVGVLFGLITTRSLVRRLHHLVTATTRFAEGDYKQRVPVTRADEVGQLEQHFNQMAEQLVESMKQRQLLIEQHARKEERALIEQEMRTAQHIQQSPLPRDVPALPDWHFTPYYKPAKEVGGDFYDFLQFDDGQLGIVVGDVSGKGVPAALVMAITRTMLRTAAGTTDSPGEVLARVNALLSADITTGMFVTCFFALLHPESGRLHYANAGHDLPYWRHGDRVYEVRATGMPLGIMPGTRYEEHDVTLAPGDSVLFYSDGLVKAHNSKREMFGFPRLMGLLSEHPGDGSLINGLLNELAAFTGDDWEQEDDVTMVVLNRTVLALDNA